MKNKMVDRRHFVKHSALLGIDITTGLFSDREMNIAETQDDSLYLVGPQDGFSPHVGSLLSMMTMMRVWVLSTVKDLTVEELDFQIDDESNSMGAMLLHLAATERYYQLNT